MFQWQKFGEKVKELYLDKKLSQKECSEQIGITESGINYILKKLKISRRIWSKSHKKIKCNEDYFSEIDSEEKAYILGLLMADGNNYIKGVSLVLQEEDIDILQKIKTALIHEGEIRIYEPRCKNCKSMSKLNVISEKISSDLSKYGVIPRKTHFSKFPDIHSSLYRHFIRGVFDGDGCIGNYRVPYFSIVGNSDLIISIQKILIENCSVNRNKLTTTKGVKSNILRLQYGGRLQVLRIMEWLYKDSSIYMERKNKIYKIIKILKP